MRRNLRLGSLLLLLVATAASARENLILEAPSAEADVLRAARIEIWRIEPTGERKLAHKGGADKALGEGFALEEGAYEIYLEDKRTGLIYRLDDHGKGLRLSKGKSARIDASGFAARIRHIKDRDAAERPRKEEALQRTREKKAVSPFEDPGTPAGEGAGYEVHAPGELLVKFQTAATLADRYAFLSDLSAGSRSKLDKLDVYRVKVSDAADLPALIRQFAADPRLKYMEMNMVVGMPEPVEEGR